MDGFAQHKTDVLVLGGGGAALRAAIEAALHGVQVLIVAKGPLAQSGATPAACPSYQAAVAMEDPEDSPAQAFEDTCKEGRYLGDENLIWTLTTEATERAQDLAQWRLKYEMHGNQWLQVQHPGHTFARNLVIRGCGYAMAAALRSKLKQLPNIEIVEDAMALELWCDDHGTVSGCLVWDMAHNRFVAIGAKAVVLATGGYAQLWKFTDTGPDLTGDGVWLAYRQGAVLCDLEMSLYYPTCLKWPPEIVGTLVQYEGLVNPRYGGAPLVNAWGQPIIEPGLPPVRDEMMRIMVSEIAAGRGTPHGGVLIDTPHAIRGPKEFLAIIRKLDSLPYNQLRDFHWDVTQTPLEVAPGIHFTLGGVTINEKAETSVPGLYAAGEVSANVHGANRTSGNALAETQVFGKRAGEHAAQWALERSAHAPTAANAIEPAARRWQSIVDRPLSPVRPHQVKESLREVMDRYMGYQRDDAGMSAGVREIQRLREEVLPFMCVRDREVMSYEWREAYEVYMMVDLADLVLRSGRMRQESRGHHWRTDFPEQRDEWCKHTTVVMGKDHAPIFGDRPVVRLTAGAVNAEAKPARGGAPSCL